ncbi:MAG TPA: histidine kinase [Opitutaceae bacterium]
MGDPDQKDQASDADDTADHIIRDTALRRIGIPLAGLIIPIATGSYGGLSWREPWWWVGAGWFLLLSWLTWHGNRLIILRIRKRLRWSERPLRKVGILILGTSLYTIPLCVLMMTLWQVAGPFPAIDGRIILRSTLVVTVVVLLMTHVYETLFLINDQLADQLRLERAERARLQARMAVLRSQLTPHFLFNCLNTLAVLMKTAPADAAVFNQHLANMSRHLIRHQQHDLVPVADELAFFHAYAELTRLRFPGSFTVTVSDFGSTAGLALPPAALQLLLENALKHNRHTEQEPLPITVRREGNDIVMVNPLRPVAEPPPSTDTGLRNLDGRYQLLASVAIRVERTSGEFRVRLPLVPAPSA